MASLKEIRGRINSVTNTRKITGAMRMVSSAKLHKAQDAIIRYYPYWTKISGIMNAYLQNDGGIDMQLAKVRPVERLAIVAFASNSSLCGAFNVNIQKKLSETLDEYKHLSPNNITVYLVGKKLYEEFVSQSPATNYNVNGAYPELADKPNYEAINIITDDLIHHFKIKEIDRVEVIYNKFKNTAVQIVTREVVLPLVPPEKVDKSITYDYIIEPSPQQLLEVLLPTVLHLQMFGALLNSYASEHGARTTAMQTATDNADELIDSLMLQYNKVRQGAITKEILDIVGGAEALR